MSQNPPTIKTGKNTHKKVDVLKLFAMKNVNSFQSERGI